MKQTITQIVACAALAVAVAAFVRLPRVDVRSESTVPAPTTLALSEKPAPRAPPLLQPAPTSQEHRASHANPADALAEFQERFERLEKTLLEMREGWAGLASRGLVPLSAEQEAQLRQQVLNVSAPARDRIDAFRLLRRHDKVTDDVALAMVDLANTSTDARTRAQAVGNLDGLDNAVIQPALVQALSDPADAEVRERAADALSSFSNDPEVEAWLRHVAENDENEDVREEALDALYERFDRMDEGSLQAVVNDANATPAERVAALGELDEESRDPVVLAAMLDVYAGSADPNLKADILRNLDGVTDPGFKAPLVEWLAHESDPRIRGEAAENLKHFRNDPIVTDWLKYAAANDESERVRQAAQAALRGREP